MQKLFYKDTHIVDFTAVVETCSFDERRKLYCITLDQTAFFPEEGGQAADTGTLTLHTDVTGTADTNTSKENVSVPSLPVLDVQIADNIIYHYIAQALPIGSTVAGHVDWSRRFDFMQQHSGEHIISGLIHSHFGLDNVGFHLGLEEVTLDMNGELSSEQLQMIEQKANEIIWQNLPVQIHYPSPEELISMDYRSKLDLTEDVRIVVIPGVDTCACCAPHVDTTGQIGCIKITGYMRHRGGVRIHILCGNRALADYRGKHNHVANISAQLSAKQNAITEAVARLREENLRQKEQYHALQGKMLRLAISTLPTPEQSAHAILFLEEINDITMRNAINELVTAYNGYCGIFVGSDEAGYRFIIGSANRDCRELAKLLREALQAKGGGTAPMIQGSIPATSAAILALIQDQ